MEENEYLVVVAYTDATNPDDKVSSSELIEFKMPKETDTPGGRWDVIIEALSSKLEKEYQTKRDCLTVMSVSYV